MNLFSWVQRCFLRMGSIRKHDSFWLPKQTISFFFGPRNWLGNISFPNIYQQSVNAKQRTRNKAEMAAMRKNQLIYTTKAGRPGVMHEFHRLRVQIARNDLSAPFILSTCRVPHDQITGCQSLIIRKLLAFRESVQKILISPTKRWLKRNSYNVRFKAVMLYKL